MRPPIVLALALAAGTGCSSGSSSAATDPDLARDLQLASMATLALVPSPATNLSAMETTPLSAPAPATRPRAARNAPRRVASPRATATSAVSEEPQDVADDDASVELAGGEAPPAEVVEGGVALPRPVPVGFPTGGSVGGDGDYSRGGRGSVIRGGDIDDCRIHDGRRRPVYRPPARTGGVGGGRWGDVARRPTTTGEATGGRWGDVARRPETPRAGGTEGQRGGSGTARGGIWGGATRGRQ